jgi:hypothetical protein
MEKKESVFLKHNKNNIDIDINNQNNKLIVYKKDILNTIPEEHYYEKNNELSIIKIEWRWRFYKINDKEYIEISKKQHGNKRLYINNDYEWVERNISNIFNTYITKEIYAYLD